MPLAFLAASTQGIEALALSMLLVFGGAKVLSEIAERLRMPGIVGEILAGILLGKSVLGWVEVTPTLHALAELGVMFLMFRVGLEVKASDLMKAGKTAALVAMLGVVVPFLAGFLIMEAWGSTGIESTFVAAALVATSVGITAQVLAGKGLLSSAAAQIIIAAAVIDDVLGLLVLAVVSSMAKGEVNLYELGLAAIVAIGFTTAVAFWGTKTMERIAPKVDEKTRASEGQFNFAMIVLFALALGAVYAGVAAIVGAFLAGMALSGSVTHRVHDLTQGVTEFLVPFFLAGIGLHLDLPALSNPSTLWLALVIVVVAILTKFLGCGLGAWRAGKERAIQVGAGMIPRGEVGMVVAQLGLSMGVIPMPVYGVVVLMAVATTIVAPPLLAWAFRNEPAGELEEHFRIG